MTSRKKDIGAYIKADYALDSTAVTAGGAGDNTEVDGEWIDRDDFLSGVLVVQWEATLAENETLSLTANFQDATDSAGAGAADYGDDFSLATTVVATGGSGGSTEKGVTEIDVRLQGAREFVRAQVTPDLSAGTTDTATVSAVMVLGGSDELPQ